MLNEIPDPLKKHMQQCYIATHVAFPPSTVETIIVLLSEIKSVSLTTSMFIFDKAFSSQMADAVMLLHKLKDQNTQSTILYQLVDDLYNLSTLA